MKDDCIAKGNTKTQTLVTLTESSVFGARFDSSVTGGNRGYARVCSAEHDSSDWKILCTVQLPHGDSGRVEGLVCAQVDAASIYDHETGVSVFSNESGGMAADDTGLISRSVEDASLGNVPNKDRRSNNYSFLHWNIGGLFSKLNDNDFIEYISSFDFICMVETFAEEFQSILFKDHTMYIKPAVRFTKQGRRSGGVICLIRNSIVPYVRELSCNSGHFLLFLLDKCLFNVSKDVLYVCAYVHPEGSPYYAYFDIDNGINLLEECLVDNILSLDDVFVFLCGDLNSRTMDIFPNIYNEDDMYEHVLERSDITVRYHRCSEDMVLNGYGKLLLNMCCALELGILNGVCNGDRQGRYTYISETGNSVNDYYLASFDFMDHVFTRCRLHVTEKIESDHLPLEFYIDKLSGENKCKNNISDHGQFIEKFYWKIEHQQLFSDLMNSVETHERLLYVTQLIDVDVNKALDMFNDILRKAAECMKKRIFVTNHSRRNTEWFDQECRLERKNVRKLLRRFRKTLNHDDRNAYCKARREYKNLLCRKKKMFHDGLLNELINSVKNQQEFWQTMHKISHKRVQPLNSIAIGEWFQHFKGVLEKDRENVEEELQYENDDTSFLDRPISKEEVLLAIRKMKNRKAAGPDGLLGEFFKFAGDEVVNFLTKLFNTLFDKGVFPKTWTESLLLPLYKKGDVNNTNNYRGIFLNNVSSKLYGSIINCRLQEWVEVNNITGEHQAGFKNDYSTIDHIFTLFAIIQKQFVNNRKLYVAFIDFEKAFDSISRKLLWPVLLKNGIKGKLYRCIKSMYDDVKAKVKCGAKFSDFISCTRGVKQGDTCSPVLFSLFINELALEIINNGRHGAILNPDFIELFIMLFADDIVLLSETVIGLQTQLNSLYNAASRLELKVNMDKSNIVVFRKGGYLSSREKWVYGGSTVSVVNSYKYLGIYFSTRLSFKLTCDDLVSKAKKAVLSILNKLYKFEDNTIAIFVKIFDAQVQPIAQYGAEVWGLQKNVGTEKVHLFAMKRFLGVGWRTPNDIVYGEFGRFPIYLNSYVKCIRYWLKLTRMEQSRLPFKAYKMLYKLDCNGRYTWASNVRKCLSLYGFSHVWDNQGVGCVNNFLQCFKQRIIDCRWQEWDDHIQTSDRFALYKTFKTSYIREPYLLINCNRFIKCALTKFRCGVSDIKVHRHRYKNLNIVDMNCPLCNSADEDEVHFVLCCPAFDDLRKQFIPLKYYRYPNLFRLGLLLATQNENILRNLCVYLYKAFKRRSVVIL